MELSAASPITTRKFNDATQLPTMNARFIYAYTCGIVAYPMCQMSNSETLKDIVVNVNIKQYGEVIRK
jgi:hypothetical protein